MPSTNLSPYNQAQGSTSDGTKFDNLLTYLQSILNGLDDANIAAGASIALSKLAMNPLGQPLALTGATAATRFVGGTASGAPGSGTFAVGDFVIDQTGKLFVCTAAGTPGTWVQVAGGSSGATTYRKTTAKTVNGTVAETDLLNGEISVGAGVLSTNGVLRLTTMIDALNTSGGAVTYRIKLKLGATTIFDSNTVSIASGANRGPIYFSAEAQNLGAANSQAWRGLYGPAGGLGFAIQAGFTTGEGGGPTENPQGSGVFSPVPWFNTSAVDTTASTALALTITMGTAHALAETKLYSALVEVL